MIDKENKLSVVKQCRLLDLARSTFYYTSVPVSVRDLELMRQIDEIHMELPFYDSRRIRYELRQRGYDVGRGHVSTRAVLSSYRLSPDDYAIDFKAGSTRSAEIDHF